jgi:hypothetical protein
MSEWSELINEGVPINILSRKDLTSPFYFKIQEKELGTLSFDSSMETGEFQSGKEVLSLFRDREEQKISLKRGESERACLFEKSGAGAPMVMTEDSNIFLLKRGGFWKGDVSLIEYESGCWYFRFHPEGGKDAASMNAEVCPIAVDGEYFLDLLVLSVFKLIEEEATSRSE